MTSKDENQQTSISERINSLSHDKRKLLDSLQKNQGENGEIYQPPQPSPPDESVHTSREDQTHGGQDAEITTNTSHWSPLVAIKASGSRPPFFCVHAIFGSAFPYYKLALNMPESQPFYGLQSPGLDGEQPSLKKIGDMAKLYIETIRKVQPAGPYYLGGYSFGGWVAYEMAQQLCKAGKKVNLLAMLGTAAPMTMVNPYFFEHMDFVFQYTEDFNKLVLNSFLSDEHRMAADLNPDMNLAGKAYPPLLSPLYQVVEANNRAQFTYVPSPYPGKITLFVTSEFQKTCGLDPTLGWKLLATEETEVHLISGNHLSMFHEPHVRDLAKTLSACLRRSEK